MLAKLHQRFFCTLPLSTASDKIFKIVHHPRLDYCRIDSKICICEVEDFKNLLEIPAFLRFAFGTKINSRNLSENIDNKQ